VTGQYVRTCRRAGARVLATAAALILNPSSAYADPMPGPVDLGAAADLPCSAAPPSPIPVPTVAGGDLGVSPGTAVTGFPPGVVLGAVHAADATAAQAQDDLTTAYNDAAGRTPATSAASDLGGLTLTPGVYQRANLAITGTLTLGSMLALTSITATTEVSLTGSHVGAQRCRRCRATHR
jgi:hypothetical protein